jgi:DMSO/TMAO reductase YedYZ heme-binding membrane subunit
MAYAEGYRGFQKGFSPRVAARAKYLKDKPDLMRSLLAPFFCMGYFHASRKRKIVSISLTIAIIGLVLMVGRVPQPWRGIIDVGVVIGLAWGIISLFIFTVQAFTSKEFKYSPEVQMEE